MVGDGVPAPKRLHTPGQPRTIPAREAAQALASAFQESPFEPLILVVDDNESVRALLRIGLRREGYRLEDAANVREARELLRTRRYGLVLCDYDLPGANGLDLLSHIREVHPDVPFILMTGHEETSLAREAIAAGALDFLPKPFDIRHLGRFIAQNRERLDAERRRATELTNHVLTGTIRALVAAVDAKDPHTASHSERVTALSLQLGNAVGLERDRLRVLEFAALLHDVGKIGIPGTILRKAGPLTEDEWDVVKQHPAGSAAIVSEVGALAEVATIVRHHHERIGGAGYPDGLSGEAIPFLARIIAIADAYEAMTSDRAYRRALTPAKAKDVVVENLGVHFDASLGAAFLDLRPD